MDWNIQFGCCATPGGRHYQEDRCVVINDLNELRVVKEPTGTHTNLFIVCINYYVKSVATRRSFYAVFDGHGGYLCSDLLARNFAKTLANHSKFMSQPLVALQEVWAYMDTFCYNEMKRMCGCSSALLFPKDGSTATVALIIGNDLYIANCGDSAAYIEYSDGSFVKVTEDHGTTNEHEKIRCEVSGGYLMPQLATVTCLCFHRKVEVGKPRLYPGGLLVTRAFGDFHAKRTEYGGNPHVVIPTYGQVYTSKVVEMTSVKDGWNNGPTMVTDFMAPSEVGGTECHIPMTATSSNGTSSPIKRYIRRIILASDGVWDGLSAEQVHAMMLGGPSPFILSSARSSKSIKTHVAVEFTVSYVLMSFPLIPSILFIRGDPIVGDLRNHNSQLKAITENICFSAVNSPFWRKAGA